MQKRKDHKTSDRRLACPAPEPRWVGTSSASIIHKLPSSVSGKNHFPVCHGYTHVDDGGGRTYMEERSKPECRKSPSTGPSPTLSAHRSRSNSQSYPNSLRCSKHVYQILPNKPTIAGQGSSHHDKACYAQSVPFSSLSRDSQSHYGTAHYCNTTKHEHSTVYGSDPDLFQGQTHQTKKEYNNACEWSLGRNKTCPTSSHTAASFINRSVEEYPQNCRRSGEFDPPSPRIYRSNSSLELRITPPDKDTIVNRDHRVRTFQDLPHSDWIRSSSVKRSEFKLYLKRSTDVDRRLTNTIVLPEKLHEASSTDDPDKLDEACHLSGAETEKMSVTSPGLDTSLPSDLFEDRLTLHVPSVRRKSGCSLSSQRSSNADSAVDLRTPEDESLDISVEEPLSTFSAVHRWKCQAELANSSKQVKSEDSELAGYDWPKDNSSDILDKYNDSHLSAVPDSSTAFSTTPFVIVSDHSSPSLAHNARNSDDGTQDQVPSPGPSSPYLAASYADGAKERRHFRKWSDSSMSSMASDAQSTVSTSTCMSYDQDQTDCAMSVHTASELLTTQKVGLCILQSNFEGQFVHVK